MKVTIAYTLLAALYSATSALEDERRQCQLDCFSRGGSSRPGEVLRCLTECPPNSRGFENKSKLRGSLKSNKAELHSEKFDQSSYTTGAKELRVALTDPYIFCKAQCYHSYGLQYLDCLNRCPNPYGAFDDDYFYDDDYYYGDDDYFYDGSSNS